MGYEDTATAPECGQRGFVVLDCVDVKEANEIINEIQYIFGGHGIKQRITEMTEKELEEYISWFTR